MGIRLPWVFIHAKQIFKVQNLLTRDRLDVPKGYLAVYVGEFQKKCFVVPISYLNHPSFQDLLCRAEEEFGFDHPMGGLTIPCREDTFINLTSLLNIYVGEIQKKRFVVPISYLNHPSFQDLLCRAEEEFGFNHPMGGLTIPCKEDAFLNLTSQLSELRKENKQQY
ncbi:hypothetical protein RJ639_037818 [Escallonia herrerae]|uniref:Small auxin up regulated protein n=1 Tax=Escallonia herrerae TaxID=1293975 RepID=A0AA88WK85_9ASTE|nr:hypothetical protein RJ639_037818 [Escallonia herrerae]